MTAEAFELVAVGPAHGRVLSILHQGAFGRETGWSEGDFARLLDTPGAFGWVAQVASPDGPQPVALVVARAVVDEAEILTIGTLPSVRRKGLAKRADACRRRRSSDTRGGTPLPGSGGGQCRRYRPLPLPGIRGSGPGAGHITTGPTARALMPLSWSARWPDAEPDRRSASVSRH